MKKIRIGVISDTHLHRDDDFETLNELINRYLEPIDLLIHAGDIVCIEALEFLRSRFCLEAVCGNMDGLEVAKQLPRKKVLAQSDRKLGIVHGAGPKGNVIDRVAREFDEVDCVVFGHTHQALRETRAGVTFINPGSPTDPGHVGRNTLGLLEIGEQIDFHIIDV